jgi:hypothetical protein
VKCLRFPPNIFSPDDFEGYNESPTLSITMLSYRKNLSASKALAVFPLKPRSIIIRLRSMHRFSWMSKDESGSVEI